MAAWKKIADFLEANARKIEKMYRSSLMRLVSRIKRMIAGVSDPYEIVKILKALPNTKEFSTMVSRAVKGMASQVAVAEKKNWREAAAASMQGKRIYTALNNEVANTAIGAAFQDIVANNARLIKTVPQDVARELSEYTAKMWTQGVRPEEIALELQQKAPQLAAYQVRRIARTESGKAATALTQVRAQSVGCDWYIWETCHDERVRDSHAKMQGVLCRWSDPPSPETLFPSPKCRPAGHYHPRGIYNCRCIALPVISMEDVNRFPVDVHIGGTIRKARTFVELKELTGQNA